jgi:hypothetical protein
MGPQASPPLGQFPGGEPPPAASAGPLASVFGGGAQPIRQAAVVQQPPAQPSPDALGAAGMGATPGTFPPQSPQLTPMPPNQQYNPQQQQAGMGDNFSSMSPRSHPVHQGSSSPPYVPGGKGTVFFPNRTWVVLQKKPGEIINEFRARPKWDASSIYEFAVAIESQPPEKRDSNLLGKVTKKLGEYTVDDVNLEQALVNLAPVLIPDSQNNSTSEPNAKSLILLQLFASETEKHFPLVDQASHLMAYIKMAVKYSYREGYPPEVQEHQIKRVLDALKLMEASERDSSRDHTRRSQMLQIIRGNYILWPEDALRTAWFWYENRHFPASRYPTL